MLETDFMKVLNICDTLLKSNLQLKEDKQKLHDNCNALEWKQQEQEVIIKTDHSPI
jgi:hypothetical protein